MLRLLAAAAVSYAVSRRLLDAAEAPDLPGPAARAATVAHDRLHRLRRRTREAIIAGRAERRAAEAELHAEYLRRSGRAHR